MKEKIAIGFDLGTTSVGWSVIKINSSKEEVDNKNLEILNMGVRLFDDPSSKSKDVKVDVRREARGRRRRIHRQKIRKYDLFLLLKKYKLISSEDEFKEIITKSIFDENEQRWLMPLDIKIKGLTAQLSKNELILILHNYIKHRGTLNTIDDEEDEVKEKEVKKLKSSYDKSKYPCENQMEWFKSTGRVLGNKENNIISNENFKMEIIKILNNQNYISDKTFIDDFIKLFERHRRYWEGPGSEKSPTPYGRWSYNEDNKIIFKENWWDSLIGKCTYYPDKDRNYKKSPITEYFNLLNDFANIKIRDENGERYFSTSEKKENSKWN